MTDGPSYNTRYRIEIIKAGNGTANRLALVLRSMSAVKQDGAVFTGTCEARRVARIYRDVEVLREGKWDIKMSFTRDGRELIPGSAEFMRDCPSEDLEGFAMPTPGQAAAARTAPAQPAASVTSAGPQVELDESLEGLEGTSIPWPYGSDYRIQDEGKLDTLARKNRVPKDGKLKIQLGPLSDRHYLIEPKRERGGGWKASRMFPDRDREEIATDKHYNRCVQAVKAYERKRALAAVSGAVSIAEAIRPGSATAPGGSKPSSLLDKPAGVPVNTGVASQKPLRWWTLKPGTTTRWTLELADGTKESGDDLEELMARTWAREPDVVSVMGWAGQRPKAAPVPLPPLLNLATPPAEDVVPSEKLRELGRALLGEDEGIEGAEL